MNGDNAILDNGRHLFAKSYEPSRSTKARSFNVNPMLNTEDSSSDDKSRSGSITPDNRSLGRQRRVSYAGHSKVCNYGYIGETRERMFDILNCALGFFKKTDMGTTELIGTMFEF